MNELPLSVAEIERRMQLCHAELAELKKLRRVALSIEAADRARMERQKPQAGRRRRPHEEGDST